MKTDLREKIYIVEKQFDVEKIQYDGIPMWPMLRSTVFMEYLHSDGKCETYGTIGKPYHWWLNLIVAWKRTSLGLFFKKNTNLLFTTNLQNRYVDGKVVNQLTEEVERQIGDFIPIVDFVEREPFNKYEKCIDHSFVISCLMVMAKLHRGKIEKNLNGVDELKAIVSYLGININWKSCTMLYVELIRFYLKWFKKTKPRALYIENYYNTIMAAIYAAKQLGVPTVELQHGCITDGHLAYTSHHEFTPRPYPDFLVCFGEKYKEYVSKNIYPPDRIIVVGYYFLDCVKKNAEKNRKLFEERYSHAKDKIRITVAGQVSLDGELLKVCKKMAENDKEIFIVYAPRIMTSQFEGLDSENFAVEEKLNIYTLVQNSDVTMGVYSTALIESLAFGTPVVMIDMDKQASEVYGRIVDGIKSVRIVETYGDAIEAVHEMAMLDRKEAESEGNLFYEADYQNNIAYFINHLDKK